MGFGLIIAIMGGTVAVVMAIMFWVRKELNLLRWDAKENRKDLFRISRNIENRIGAIQSEMKDFHFRLIEIERKKK
jgi:hypothetical protein